MLLMYFHFTFSRLKRIALFSKILQWDGFVSTSEISKLQNNWFFNAISR
jgi:hypothetical protein